MECGCIFMLASEGIGVLLILSVVGGAQPAESILIAAAVFIILPFVWLGIASAVDSRRRK